MSQPSQPSQNPVESSGPGMFELMTWFEVNKFRVIALGVLALVIGVAIWLMGHFKEQKEQEASSKLLALRPASQNDPGAPASEFQKLAEQYASTKAGNRAQLLAATTAFTENQYETAQKEFAKFLSENSGSPWAATAAYGVAASIEALNRQDEALQAYQKVVSQFGRSAEAVSARFAMARIHEAKNQPEQALKIYDEMATPSAPGQTPDPEVISRREQLFKKHPQLRPAAVAPPATNAAAPSLSAPAPSLSSPTPAEGQPAQQ